MKKRIISIISIATCTLFFQTTFVDAQGLKNALGNLQKTAQPAGVEQGDIGTIVGSVINAALTLVGVIFLVLMVYAGFLWMTARGEEDQINKAKKIIIGTMIGLIITVSAYAITIFVTGQLGAN
jgi:hypothetical protein